MTSQPDPALELDKSKQQALHQRLLADIKNAEHLPDGAFTLRAQDGEWQRFDAHIDFKVLFFDEKTGTQTALWRLQPGAIFPSHPHKVDEECLVLQGEIMFGQHQLYSGDFHFMKAGHTHPVARSESGALLLIRAEKTETPGAVASVLLAAHNLLARHLK